MSLPRLAFLLSASVLLTACPSGTERESWSPDGKWIHYSPESTGFSIWSPDADSVRLNLYSLGNGGEPEAVHQLSGHSGGIWSVEIEDMLDGTYYTYQVHQDGRWLAETPGIYAQAVGVNGQRAMVLDMDRTDPPGWAEDRGPEIDKPNEAILYELHIRDMTIHPASGSAYPGTYNGLAEDGIALKHIVEMGVTHVHLLPTFDHYSIDESRLDVPQFNWGYDPQNYNVPEGSFSLDPFAAAARVAEFKEMVKAFHDAGIGVILDVVYNHTGRTDESAFNMEAPRAYYRLREDGSWSDASACGNETASERPRMRDFMIESVLYWAREYHIDGFRFDLMGIHDIETMNQLAAALEELDPRLFVYGEGWTAGDSPLPEQDRALKKHTHRMQLVSAFSDDIRDGLKGSVFDEHRRGFVSGAENTEESVKFGVVGSIQHDQIDYAAVNYSDAPWAAEPWQSVSYVSCHDNNTLYDKLKLSCKDVTESQLVDMHELANAVVLTSQGIPFLHAGVEMLRTKGGEHNSYKSPDSVNQIDWNWKTEHQETVSYYQNLITLRKAHPAFSMPDAETVRGHLRFDETASGLIRYTISDYANGDSWANIHVIYNARETPVAVDLQGDWKVAVLGDQFNSAEAVTADTSVPPISMAVFYQD